MSRTLLGKTASYPEVTVEFGFSSVTSNNSLWGTGTWNSGKWSGRDVVWTDVTDYVRSIQTTRERNRDTDTYTTGTATVVFSNVDARFTPANTSGPYTSGGVTKIVPKVPMRIRATWNGVTYGLFQGRVNSWQDDYPGAGKDCVTTVVCSDVLADLIPVELATAVAAGAGETAGTRITRLLNAAGWVWGNYVDSGSISTMQATTLGDNAFDLIRVTVESEGGVLFADGDGQLVFQDAFYPAGGHSSRATTAQITFGSGVGEVKFADPSLTYDDTLIFNESSVTCDGGVAQASSDPDSVSLYGSRSVSRTGLVNQTDAQSKQLADLDIFRFADPEYRVAALFVRPASSPTDYWPLVLDSRFGDYCVAKVPTPSGITITRDVFVSGLSHTINRDGDWTVRFGFSSAAPYVPVWGGWDVGLWDTVCFFA